MKTRTYAVIDITQICSSASLK